MQMVSNRIYETCSGTSDFNLNFADNRYIFEYFKSDMIKVSDGNVWRSTDYVAETIARKYVLGNE